MREAVERLREKAQNEKTAIALNELLRLAKEENKALRARVARMEGLVQTLLDEDPNETIADNGSTVLCAWRYDARRALEEK